MKIVFFNPTNGYSAVYKLSVHKEDRGYSVNTHCTQCNKYTGALYKDYSWDEIVASLDVIDRWIEAQKAWHCTCYCEVK